MIYAFFLFVFVQKSFLTKKSFLYVEINFTTLGPLYTCLVFLQNSSQCLQLFPLLEIFYKICPIFEVNQILIFIFQQLHSKKEIDKTNGSAFRIIEFKVTFTSDTN